MQSGAENAVAMAGVAHCFIKLGELEQAAQILDAVTEEHAKHTEIVGAKAALDLATQASQLGETGPMLEKLARDADDHATRFELALVLWAGDQREEAATHLLEIIRRDRSWEDDKARKQLLQFFEVAGPMDPFTVSARRQLSSMLFS